METPNPKDLIGVNKIPYSCLPAPVVAEVAVAMYEGALKYGRNNYREAKVISSIYLDATKRHMDAFLEGEDIDPDSDIHHLSKAIASLMVLRDGIISDQWIDDRPIQISDKEWMIRLNEKVETLRKKNPKSKEPYIQKKLRDI